MLSGDSRKDFILIASGNYFGVSGDTSSLARLCNSESLNNFLDDGNYMLLCATLSHSGDKTTIHFSNKVESVDEKEKILIFLKLKPDIITPDNLHKDIIVSSVLESPINTLYHALQKLYAPMLLKDLKWSNKFDPGLQNLLAQLESGLGAVIRRQSSISEVETHSIVDRSTILTPYDELQYWIYETNTSRDRARQETAKRFSDVLTPLVKSFDSLGCCEETLEIAYNVLDDMWRVDAVSYSEDRMVHLLEIIGNDCVRSLQVKLTALKLWESSFNLVEDSLLEAIHMCSKWSDICQKLTSTFWPQNSLHCWKGKPFVPNQVLLFSRRLNEILDIRLRHVQLVGLFSVSEQAKFGVENAFMPFLNLNAIQCNPYTEPYWQAAVSQFDKSLRSVEDSVAKKLKALFQDINNPLQLLQNFKRYCTLVKIPYVAKVLTSERALLLSHIKEYIALKKMEFSKISDDSGVKNRDKLTFMIAAEISSTVNLISWTRQLEIKIKDIALNANDFFRDLPEFDAFLNQLSGLSKQLRDYQNEQFSYWLEEVQDLMNDNALSLCTGEPVLTFAKDLSMKVTYNSRLCILMRDVRQLGILGFNVPVGIKKCADLAKMFSKQAKDLQQIANFHNSIGDQMIVSQRSLMLEAAVHLENLVKQQSNIAWNDIKALDKYIRQLQQATENLSMENRKLRGHHVTVCDIVMSLMNTDLLRHQQMWKNQLLEIRHLMSRLEQQGYSKENMKAWKAHWDRQLYKALEHQYQMGLTALNENLPEIRVELVYRQRRLQFRPPIEEIQSKYYGHLKRFFTIPSIFKGVNDVINENLIFPVIIDRNAHFYISIYKKAEIIFEKLEALQAKFLNWVCFGTINVDEFISEHLTSIDDWDRSFRTVKAKSQELGRLPSEDRIDCITINYAPVKAVVDDHLQALWDVLKTSLRKSIIDDVREVEDFLKNATDTLSKRPYSIEEIGLSNVKRHEYEEKSVDMFKLLQQAEVKNKLLCLWVKEKVETVVGLKGSWDTFERQMDCHKQMITKQVDDVKASLSKQLQNFEQEIEHFSAVWHQFKPKQSTSGSTQEQIMSYILFIKDKRVEFNELLEKQNRLREDCYKFGLNEPKFSSMETLNHEITKTEASWLLFEEFQEGMKKYSSEQWIVFRSKTFLFEDYLIEWLGKLKPGGLSGDISDVTVQLLQEIDAFKACIPLLKYCQGDMFCEEHWVELFAILGIHNKTSVETLVFGDLLNVKDTIVLQASSIKDLAKQAQEESNIRQALSELDIWAVTSTFSFTDYIDSSGQILSLIKDWKDIFSKIGDNRSLLQALRASPYYKTFSDRASLWESKLADLDEYLSNLNNIQRKWVYLEPIFGRGTMAKEQSRFSCINDDFRSVMADIYNSKRIITLCNMSGLKRTLTTLLDQLQRCQKSLNDFLEEKRLRFPRFYFIGDDDLLEILGQSTNAAIIQAHLKKLFMGIHAVEFDGDCRYILGIKSVEGELVTLQNKIYISQDVEHWLGDLAGEMKSTLRSLLLTYVNNKLLSKPYEDIDFFTYPQQIICLGELIIFSKHCEEAVKRGMLNSLAEELKARIHYYAMTDIKQDTENKVYSLKMKALILDAIHCSRIVEQLLSAGVNSLSDWNWQKQLRFYIYNETVIGKMVDAEFSYTYEYQGNAPRLVHTPLTDKCYLALTQALSMGLGGNPYGPAGTGKTESVKALGGLLGRQVLVFNCDEGIDVDSMGRILVGIVKCGAWGCFDEFNRLEEIVLSAVSMQIQTIQAALKNQTHKALLLGSEIQTDPNSGIFITLNPLGKGYGGRQKLPDNLKQLFCPVVMSVPDNELIAEVLLFSEGYKYAREIGRKIVAVFSLAKELLTPQKHYDWGLRALKTVLKSCGSHLQMTKCNLTDEEKLSHSSLINESQLAVQALCMNTVSKLTFSDSQRFNCLIRDVFMNIEYKELGYESLKGFINESCLELGLTVIDAQVQKMVELYEQLQQRTGVVIVGPSGSSKSTVWKTLLHALKKMKKNFKYYIINPKAITRTQLLGCIDIDTREWTDGILTQIARKVAKEPQDLISWIVFDGDIDPEWIEALNSVLDDNRLLTMPSGERIQFGSNVNLLFETHELQYASPATVSRMGVIHLSDEDMDLKAIITSWINAKCGDNKQYIINLIDDYFYQAFHWVYSKNDFALDISRLSLIMNQLILLTNVKSKPQFAIALIKGMGKTLNANSQEAFAKQVFQWIQKTMSEAQSSLNFYYDENADDLATYSSEATDDITLESLHHDILPVVRTPYMQNHIDCITPWLHETEKRAFLLVGPEGCGKSLLLHHCFQMQKSVQIAVIHCSATTTPNCILQKLNQVCLVVTSNNGRVYKPKECVKLVLYLRDLNLSKPDKWGTSQLIAFLQQVITYGGFYDSSLEWVWLDSIQIVGSLAASNALGRYPLSPRFTSLVKVYNMSYPNKEELQRICSAYLHPVLLKFLPKHPIWGVTSKIYHLAGTMVHIYEQTSKTFSVDEWNHYSFTPRELLKWVLGLLHYDLESFINDVTSQSIIEILAYECRRIFQDRLVGMDSKLKQESILQSILSHEWGIDLEITKGIIHHYSTWGARAEVTISTGAPVPHFGKPLGKLSSEDLQCVINKGILQYSREHRKLDLIVFEEVLEQVSKIDRILSVPEGSLLLSGPSGVGRHSVLNIVATLHGMTVLSPRICHNYNRKRFCNDLKLAMQATGIDGQEIVFVVEDYQLIENEFLELINGLISTGEIPGLYSPEELEHLLTAIRDQAAQEGFRGSNLSFFSQRIKKKLHVVLIMDSSNPNLSAYFESNPALYKLCYVNWIEGWCKKSMLKIPQVLLAKTINDESVVSNVKETSSQIVFDEELAKYFYQVHASCPINVATPRRYLNFIHSYKSIFVDKKNNLEQQKKHLEAGVSKLSEARIIVDKLKSQASQQTVLLREKQAEADTALDLITNSMQSAGDQKIEMESLREQTMKENEKLSKRKKEIDAELSEIEPLVQEAKAAVGNIKSESLAEIRSLRAPPDVIRDILEAVLNLMGNYDTSWNSMKSFLAKRGVKEEICSFDVRNITSQSREAVEELLKARKESFDPKYAKRASVAAAPLASWVQANVRYAKVLNKIKPLEQEQMKLQRNLAKAEGKMGKLSSDLENVDKYVAELRERLNRFTKEAASIEINLKKAHETINAAESLVEKLEDEFNRWSRQIGELSDQLKNLSIQVLLAAAFINYLSSLVEDSRYKLLNEWLKILKVQKLDLRRFLSSEKDHIQWHNEGLPSDDLSLENAVIINQASLRPLLIDPAGKATEWLKVHLKDTRLEIITQHDPNFGATLELAIRFGKTLLIREITSIEPVLFPLLRHDLIAMGPRYFVQIGDKLIDYNEDFRLFLSTKSLNLNISPQAEAIITTVNFTTTTASLHGQLLALAIQHDKPELEERRSELLHQEEELKNKVSQLEDYLLEQLGSARGNILENKELLASLNDAKKSSATVIHSLNESLKLQQAIAKERDAYLPLAEFGSSLFFAVTKLTKINNMYSFSLSSFLQLFKRALTTTSDGEDIQIRITKLKEHLLRLVYKHVSTAMFKADHLMLALHFVHALNANLFEENEWEAFIGTLVADLKTDFGEMKKSLPSWISEERALAFSLLKNVFPNLYTSLNLDNSTLWNNFANSNCCEQDIPSVVLQKLSIFQQVLVVQALRPDRLQSAMTLFCTRALGFSSLSPAPISFNKLGSETVAEEPVLIIISVGADPSQELQEIAYKVVGEEHYHQIAMGQGQADVAIHHLKQRAKNGGWLCLSNLHLVTAWLPVLEKEYSCLSPHPNFRLWLTSEPHPNFSDSLLQRCLKFTFEAPPGIRQNLQRTYNSWPVEFISRSGSVMRAQALFSLAWFHAVIQERRNFIPEGWSKFYEFNYADLKAGAHMIDRFCEAAGRSSPQWDYIYGLFESVVYGGKIDNVFDMKVLTTYLKEFFNLEVISGTSLSKKHLGPGVNLPLTYNLSDYVDMIDKMSDQNRPEYFGLPANIEQSAERTFSSHVISRLRLLLRSTEAIQKYDREGWQAELSPILNLWKKLNQNSKLVRAQVVSPSDFDSPLKSVIQLEYYIAVTTVQYIHSTLAALSKALRGTSLLIGDVQKLAVSLVQQETPALWLNYWQGPLDPIKYLRVLMMKAVAIDRWIQKVEKGTLLSESLNMAELFYPERFLNALRQQTARELNTSMDNLMLVTIWHGSITNAVFPVSLTSLRISGCLFDGKQLMENSRGSPNYTSVPDAVVAWIHKNNGIYKDEDVLSIPVYDSKERTSVVTCLDVPCYNDRNKWIKCSVALFLECI